MERAAGAAWGGFSPRRPPHPAAGSDKQAVSQEAQPDELPTESPAAQQPRTLPPRPAAGRAPNSAQPQIVPPVRQPVDPAPYVRQLFPGLGNIDSTRGPITKDQAT